MAKTTKKPKAKVRTVSRPAKKKPAQGKTVSPKKPKPAASAPIVPPGVDFPPQWIEPTLLLVISGANTATLQAALTSEKIGVPAESIDALVTEAKRRIVLAANFDHQRELGLAIARLNDLYNRAVSMADIKSAISAQKEINRLLRLNNQTSSNETDQAKAGETEADATLASIEAHLRPLNLAPDSYPIDELARILAHKLIDQAEAKQ